MCVYFKERVQTDRIAILVLYTTSIGTRKEGVSWTQTNDKFHLNIFCPLFTEFVRVSIKYHLKSTEHTHTQINTKQISCILYFVFKVNAKDCEKDGVKVWTDTQFCIEIGYYQKCVCCWCFLYFKTLKTWFWNSGYFPGGNNQNKKLSSFWTLSNSLAFSDGNASFLIYLTLKSILSLSDKWLLYCR